MIVTNNNFFEASDYLSTCIQEIAEVMPELVILNDMNKEYIDYDKIIEWSIKKSTSDNQIYEFFQELEEQFGELANRKLILTHRKDLIKGDILIDDRPNNGADKFQGVWIQFGSQSFPDWKSILIHLNL